MTRFDRYCLARLTVMFGFFALVMALVFWVNRAVSLFDRLIADGQSFLVFLEFTALSLPAVIRSAVPIAAFAAALHVATRLRGDSETVAMQAAGASAFRLARPALVFGLLAALLLSLIVHALLPASRARLDQRAAEASEDLAARLLTDGAFLHPAPGVTFYLAEIAPDGELRGVFLSDARDPAQRVTYTARSAVLSSGPQGPSLVMFDGLAQTLEADGRLFVTRFEDFAYDVGALIGAAAPEGPGLKGTPSLALLRGDPVEPPATAFERRDELHARAAQPAMAVMGAVLGFAALALGRFSRFGAWRQVGLAVGIVIALKLLEGALRGPVHDVPALWPLHYLPAALGLAVAALMLRWADAPRRPGPPGGGRVTLHLYLARRFARAFLGVLGAFAAALSLVDLAEQARRLEGTGAGFREAAGLALLNAPRTVHDTLPLVAVIAAIALFLALGRSSEMVAIRAAGRGGMGALRGPVAVALALGALAVAVLNPIVAATAQRFEALEERYRGEGSVLSIEAGGLWLRQGDPSGQTVIRAAEASLDGTVLREATFVTFSEAGPARRIEARRAELVPGAWAMTGVKDWPLLAPNPEAAARVHEALRLPTDLTRAQIRDSFGDPSGVSVWELPAFVEALDAAGFSARAHRMRLHEELASPLLLAAMVMAGAAFTMRPARGGPHGAARPRRGADGLRALLPARLRPGARRQRRGADLARRLGAAHGCRGARGGAAAAPGGRVRRALALALGLLGAPAPAQEAAQEAATILADRVVVEQGALLAEGDVEVTQGGTRLTASAIRYDRESDAVTVTGPIRVEDASGAVVLADAAALDADLEEGILTSARLVLDRQLQIAAAELARAGGVTRLTRAVASSCHVCAGNPVPLWEIRAARVTQDEAARLLYFDRAQLRVAGVPVLYLPRLRLPGPGNDRARGFLVPRLRSTSRLGTGLIAPYFVPLGSHADVTLSPYLSGSTRTMGLRYRQAFRRGTFEIEGAVTDDDLRRDELRGYAFAQGAFALPRGFALDLDLRAASDDTYLLDYGVSDEDRLASAVTVARARPREYVEARVLGFQDLRGRDVAATSPRFQTGFVWDRRLTPGLGTLDLGVSGDGYLRDASLGRDTAVDRDSIADGRDAVRLGASATWRGAQVLPGGLVLAGLGRLDADTFEVADDDAFPDRITRVLPTLGAVLRWPLRRAAPSGALDVLEPALALAWSPEGPDAPPPEDSARVELDPGNLLALSRLPGEDAVERGARGAVGLGWRRFGASGWEAGATLGRVLRADEDDRLAPGTGLGGTASDWLAAVDLDTGAGLSLGSRALVGDDLDLSLTEAVLAYAAPGLSLDAGYVWLAAATGPDGIARPDTSQLTLDADMALTRRWSGSAGLRYDFREERAQTAGLGLTWRNECAELDLTVSRRFEDSSSLDPETRFGLSVALLGFGDREAAPDRSTCDPVFR